MTLYEHTKHPHKPRNVNVIHRETLTVNDHVALWVSRRVGTMWFCYALALIMTLWGGMNVALGKNAVDPFPFSFLFFCLGGIMQSLLMPLIMVAQNLDAHHQELQAEESYQTTMKIYHDIEQIIHHLDAQDRYMDERILAHLEQHTEQLALLKTTQPTAKMRVVRKSGEQ